MSHQHKARSKKIRVLLWSPAGAGLHYGGAATSAFRLYSAADPNLFEVSLAHVSREQTNESLFKEIIDLGPLDEKSPVSLLQYISRSKKWLKKNHMNYDVLHGISAFESTFKPAIFATKLGLPAFVKPISYQGGFGPTKGLRKWLKMPERRRRLSHRLNGIIAISSAIENELLSYSIPSKIIYRIPNGVNIQRFSPPFPEERAALREKFGFKGSDFIVLFVGSLDPRKQPFQMMKSLTELLIKNPDIKLLYIGPCKGEMGHIENHAKNYNISSQVRLLGMRSDVEIFYKLSEVYCLPSLNEGMPNALLEAMASGIPCIATPVSGSEDLIVDGTNGFFLRSFNDLSGLVSNYYTNTSLAESHGKAARELILQQYSAKVVAQRHYDMFNDSIQPKKLPHP